MVLTEVQSGVWSPSHPYTLLLTNCYPQKLNTNITPIICIYGLYYLSLQYINFKALTEIQNLEYSLRHDLYII